jgi:dimethylaniline monooxygenase (N-oxide forming)
MQTVAVIGAGPSGLAAAKFLKSEGFVPVVFEQGRSVGGQWSGDPAYSGVWPSMRTNTSRVMTSFSDLRHEPGTPLYPTNQAMHAYLERYAQRFGLMSCIRLQTRVLHLDQDPKGGGWLVRFEIRGEGVREQRFDKVVVASGRYNKPVIPAIPGLQSFSGAGGVAHSFQYKDPERYRGQRVLVGGASISAVEIASDLALLGAAHVIAAYRRQHYIHPKIIAGIPADQLLVTRYQTHLQQNVPADVTECWFTDLFQRFGGRPEQYGALQPAGRLNEAGATMSQTFLPLVAEGRIGVKPWIQAIDGQAVHFSDGTVEIVDALVFGTGYELNLPFLSEGLRNVLGVDASHIGLYLNTFHPDLPGLAFIGIMNLVGTIFPVLELQARWVAYVLSGALPLPALWQMRSGVATCNAARAYPSVAGHFLMSHIAHAAGVEPQLEAWPELASALLFGPMSAISYRLSGRDSLTHAAQVVAEDARAIGVAVSPEFTEEQCAQMQALAKVRKSEVFREFVERVMAGRQTPKDQAVLK